MTVRQPPVVELRGVELPAADLAGWTRVDLTIWRGELVTLAGPARSGKSALLNVLGLLDRPARGRYLLNGADTTRLSDRDRSALRGREIGFVFQRRMLLPTRSVLDNVMLPLRYAGMRRKGRLTAALDCLDLVGLTDRAHLMIWQLSAGELALCALARALVTQPGLLLCDDPTAGVEQATATRLIGLLTGLHRQGRTLVVATADQLAAAYSSRSVRMGAYREQVGIPDAVPLATTDTTQAGSLP